MYFPSTPSRSKSSGAALLVSLILLLIMTLIGISAVDNVTLQSQMVRNSQWAQDTYQIALSEIQKRIKDMNEMNLDDDEVYLADYLNEVMTAPDDTISYSSSDPEFELIDASALASQSVSVGYQGIGAPPSGYEIGDFVGQLFTLNSVATATGSGVDSDQTQGFNYPAPK